VIVDPVTVRLLNRRQLVAADFGPPREEDLRDLVLAGGEPPEREAAGIHLRPTGRKIVIREFLSRLRETIFVPRRGGVVPYLAGIEAQAYQMAHVLSGREESYEAFTVR
jgi:CRISPR/Cas system-associated endonuclease Cas1